MQLSIEEFRDAVDLLGNAGGAEAAIVAQLVLDLAVSARFNNDGEPLGKNDVRKLLQLRISRHRAAKYQPSGTIH